MARLSPQGIYRKDGSKVISSYKISLAKVSTEEIAGFNKDTELDIEYKKDTIILKRKK